MILEADRTYRVNLSDGSSYTLLVICYAGDHWYKVKSGEAVFFVNLSQAVKVFEV
jgi:hypothetical protein